MKKNIIGISIISLLPVIYLFFLWLIQFSDFSFTDFLFAYFDNIVDFSDYMVRVKYIAGWIKGDVTWEYAQLVILNPTLIMNFVPMIPIILLILVGFNAYLANLIIATLAIFITNLFLLKIFDKLLNGYSLLKILLILVFTFFNFTCFYRSYANQACFILSVAGIYLVYQYMSELNIKYLKYLSILVFISFLSYAFAMLFLLSIYFCIGLYLLIKKYSLKKWLIYFIYPLSGIVLFLITNFISKKYLPDYYEVISIINKVNSILPSIDFSRFILLVCLFIFSLWPIISNIFYKKSTIKSGVFYIFTFSLLIAHFHTLIDKNAIYENWHFNEVIQIIYFISIIVFINFILSYKKDMINKVVLTGLILIISFLVLPKVNFNLNNNQRMKENLVNINEIKKIKNGIYYNVIVDSNIANAWQNYKYSNPILVSNSTIFFFIGSFENKIDLQVLSFLSSNNAMDSTQFKIFYGWYFHNYLSCSYNYHRLRLCKIFKNNELCDFYNKNLTHYNRNDILHLFSNNDKLFDFFYKAHNPVISQYYQTYFLALKDPLPIINKHQIKYGMINKSSYFWWKEKTYARILDSTINHYLIKF